MAEKKRKSSRSFELEKGGKRFFDLQKTSARKFDLSKESDEVSLDELKKDLLADGKIDDEEVNKLRERLFADGKIDQDEADFLFEINEAVSGKSNDSSWKAFFVEAISDYLLNDEKSPGVIDEDEGKWLEAKINNDGKLDTVERALVASLRRKSKSMPKSLGAVLSRVASRFDLKKDEVPAAEAATAEAALAATKAKANRFNLGKETNDTATTSDKVDLQRLKKDLLADGKIDADEVKKLRKVLYADGKIDQEEADFLFELNDAVSGKKNDPSWNQFFVQAISDYLLNDEKSPGVIDEEEGRWLIEKIGVDGQVDGVEKQLLDNLNKNSKKMPAAVAALLSGSAVSQDSTLSGDAEEPKSKKWLWILLAVVLAAVVTYFCMKSCKDNKEEQRTEQVTSNVSGENGEQVNPEDSTVANTTSQSSPSVDAETSGAGNSETSSVTEPVDVNAAGQVGAEASRPEVKSDEETRGGEKTNVKPSETSKQSAANMTDGKSANQPQNSTAVFNYDNTGGRGPIEEEAVKVIRGVYGNNPERRQLLGANYEAIQKRVNEMYRQRHAW